MDTNSTTPATTSTKAKPRYITLDQFISQSRTTLTNAALPDIAPLLQKRSYPAPLLQSKLAELDTLVSLNEAQKKEYGEQYAATEAYRQAMADLREDYMEHLTLARLIFKDDTAAKTALELKGARKKSDSGLTAQALLFYNGALASPAYQTALDAKGIDTTELQAGKVGFDNLSLLAAAQTKETGEAQKATADRDAAYDAFGEWMDEFLVTAEIALRKTPQLMEKLGLVQG